MIDGQTTDLRQTLVHVLDEAVASHAPLLVTRQGGRGNVVIPFEETFEGWQAAVHKIRRRRGRLRSAYSGSSRRISAACTPWCAKYSTVCQPPRR